MKFGTINDSVMHLSELGEIVAQSIADLPNHPPFPEIVNSIVMPNHVHILVGARPAAPASSVHPPASSVHPAASTNLGCLKPPMHGDECADFHHNSTLSVVVGGLKSAVTRKYNSLMLARQAAPLPRIWQRLYHEHIVRSQRAFDNIMNYIDNNVANWSADCFHKNYYHDK